MLGGALGGLLSSPGLVTTPAGAALGGAAGEAARQLYDRATGKPAPGTMTDAAMGIGKEGAAQGAIEAAGGLVTKGAGKVAETVYRGYLKPALNAVDLPKAREIVSTALNEGIAIAKGGEDKARRLITELNKQVQGVLANTPAGRVDLRQIADKVRSFAKTKYFRPGVPSEDFEAAMRVADNIDNHPSLIGPSGAKAVAVNPSDANRVKQGLDTAVGDRAFGVERGAATEARKQGRHATREAIESVAPEVGPLNAREAKVIDALEAVQKATGREENRNAFFGVPSLLAGAAGGAVGYQQGDTTQGMVTALVARGLLTPAVASRAAILASRFAKVPGTVPATAVRIALKVLEQEGQQAVDGEGK